MIESKAKHPVSAPSSAKKRRFLLPEKKYQIFLETQSGTSPVGEVLRRESLYSTDLLRIREKVKEGALERLADRPGARSKTVPLSAYEALKGDLEERERVLAEQAVEPAILRKKQMEVRGRDRGNMADGGAEGRDSFHG